MSPTTNEFGSSFSSGSSSLCECLYYQAEVAFAEADYNVKKAAADAAQEEYLQALAEVQAEEAKVAAAEAKINEKRAAVDDEIVALDNDLKEMGQLYEEWSEKSIERHNQNEYLMKETEIANSVKLGLLAEAARTGAELNAAYRAWLEARGDYAYAIEQNKLGILSDGDLQAAKAAFEKASGAAKEAIAPAQAAAQAAKNFVPNPPSPGSTHLAPMAAKMLVRVDKELDLRFGRLDSQVDSLTPPSKALAAFDHLLEARDAYDTVHFLLSIARCNRDGKHRDWNTKEAAWERARWDRDQAVKALQNCESSPTCDGGVPDPLPNINCTPQQIEKDIRWGKYLEAQRDYEIAEDQFNYVLPQLDPAAMALNHAVMALRRATNAYNQALQKATTEDALFAKAVEEFSESLPLLSDVVILLAAAVGVLAATLPELLVVEATTPLAEIIPHAAEAAVASAHLAEAINEVTEIWDKVTEGSHQLALASVEKCKSDAGLLAATKELRSTYKTWREKCQEFMDLVRSCLEKFNDLFNKRKAMDDAYEDYDAALMDLDYCEKKQAAFQ
jgi:hypothetical protein